MGLTLEKPEYQREHKEMVAVVQSTQAVLLLYTS